MKSIFTTLIVLLFPVMLFSQIDSSWNKGGKFALTVSQVSFSNWAAGGENSFGGNSMLNLFANYKKGKRIWDTNLDLAYGMMKLEGKKSRKTDDKIDFFSKYGYKISNNLYASSNFKFSTQFYEGFKYPDDTTVVSTFLSPAYCQFGLGVDFKPSDYFSLSFLPATGKVTIVMDQTLANQGAYGVEKATYDTIGDQILVKRKGNNYRFELGAALQVVFKKELVKNIELQSRLQLFSNYLDNPQNIDINWDSMLSLKVNKYISTFVGVSMLYDDDIKIADKDGVIGPRTQIKQTFGLGLAMNF
jgi:hypothetical protein